MKQQPSIAVVYGVPAGGGGLGMQAATALTALAGDGATVDAFGAGRVRDWPLPGGDPSVVWHQSTPFPPTWALRYTWWRWYQGDFQLRRDRRLGAWAKREIERLRPATCYVFTQVGLETLSWAKQRGVATVLDNPNGHIRHYKGVFSTETRRWSGTTHLGHPTDAMIARVEKEYQLADRIRVSSGWAKHSMTRYGVPAGKIEVIQQPLDLVRFRPSPIQEDTSGPLRLCYVGSLNLAKGFQYLTRAIKLVGADQVILEIVGATGTRAARRVFERERKGIRITVAPGDPVPAYQRGEVFVLPSLHDGFGFVVAEAMSCGLPVIVTENCGAAEWVRHGKTGWVIPSGREDALAEALVEAIRRRSELKAMGALARTEVEQRAAPSICLKQLRDWVHRSA